MKKKDYILGGGFLLLALLSWLFTQFLMPRENNLIRISVNGEIYGEYALTESQIIKIGETNVCEISDNRVKMIQADCPDQLCVKQKAVDARGGTIVCLPNKVVIEALIDSSAEEDIVDAVS